MPGFRRLLSSPTIRFFASQYSRDVAVSRDFTKSALACVSWPKKALRSPLDRRMSVGAGEAKMGASVRNGDVVLCWMAKPAAGSSR